MTPIHSFVEGDIVKFIGNLSDVSHTLTVDQEYTVERIDQDGVYVKNDRGHVSSYMHYRFKLSDQTDIITQIKKAKSLIGKVIINKNHTNPTAYAPTAFGVGNTYSHNSAIREEARKNGDFGNVVYVEDDDNLTFVDEAEVVVNTIQINDTYHAVIKKDVIEVGCQEISIEKVKEIVAVWNTLHG